MFVALHPNSIRDTIEVGVKAGDADHKQAASGALKHGALSFPCVGGITLNLYPCVGVWQIEVGDVDSVGI
jgi:hypothetical protein